MKKKSLMTQLKGPAGICVDDAVASLLLVLCGTLIGVNIKNGFRRLLTDFAHTYGQRWANYCPGAHMWPNKLVNTANRYLKKFNGRQFIIK